MHLIPRVELSLDIRLETIQRQLDDLQETQELLVNYLQQVSRAMGIQEKVKHLDVRLEEIQAMRLADAADRREEDTKP